MSVSLLIIVIFWALGCIYMYLLTGDVVEQLKQKHPDSSPLMYDVIDVIVCLFWPLLIPSIFIKAIKRIKEKKNK